MVAYISQLPRPSSQWLNAPSGSTPVLVSQIGSALEDPTAQALHTPWRGPREEVREEELLGILQQTFC